MWLIQHASERSSHWTAVRTVARSLSGEDGLHDATLLLRSHLLPLRAVLRGGWLMRDIPALARNLATALCLVHVWYEAAMYLSTPLQISRVNCC